VGRAARSWARCQRTDAAVFPTAAALTLGERPSGLELAGGAVVITGLLYGLARPRSQRAYGSVAPARAS
jgi:hypothetical protein